MDGCPLGLGLVVEDKPTEFSCMGVSGPSLLVESTDSYNDHSNVSNVNLVGKISIPSVYAPSTLFLHEYMHVSMCSYMTC